MTGASAAIYVIATICNTANLNECRPMLGFSDMQPGYTREMCQEATVSIVEDWLKANEPKWYLANIRCGLNEERGA